MKQVISVLLALTMLLMLFSGCGDTPDSASTGSALSQNTENAEPSAVPSAADSHSIAMVTDYSDVSDQSLNQAVYEACVKYCEKHRLTFNYYRPLNDTDESRLETIDTAVSEGYGTILMTGETCAAVTAEAAQKYPDTQFVAMDISADALGSNGQIPDNVYCMVFRGELCGYMAGYASVKLGYTQLGFVGAAESESVKRYGYGFVQGANQAAKENGETDVVIRYCCSGSSDDESVTELLSTWYAEDTDLIFAAGGNIYDAAASAANSVAGTMIGSETDQKSYIRSEYKKCTVLTSAMKDFYAAVCHIFPLIESDAFPGGTEDAYGLISDTPDDNYVKLSDSLTYNRHFLEEDYDTLVASIRSGALPVSFDASASPSQYATYITVNDEGTIS